MGWSVSLSQIVKLAAYGRYGDPELSLHRCAIHFDHHAGAFPSRSHIECSTLVYFSMGLIDNCYDHGHMESFWARMQVELLNRKP